MARRHLPPPTVLALASVAATLVAAGVAAAEPTPEQVATARALARAGVAEADVGDCDAAVAKLARAEALYHAPTIAEPLGECQIKLGKLVAGTETLNRLVREQLPAGAPPAFVAAQDRARDALAQALPRIAKLRVHLTARCTADAAVIVDGEPLSAALLDVDRPTDPGSHVVRAAAPGCTTAERAVTLSEGQTQVVAIDLVATAAPAPVDVSAPVTPTIAPPVDAPPRPTATAAGVHTHDGFYFRAGLGAALFAGGSITPPRAGVDVDVSGAGPSLELAFGGTPWRGLAVGGGIYGMSAPGPSYSANGVSLSGGAAVVSSIGPFADWYVDPHEGLHVQAAIGLAAISAAKGTPKDIGGTSYAFPASDQSGSGVSLLAGVGYDWWIGDQLAVGALARLQYVAGSVKGSGDVDSTSVKVLLPAVLGTLTYQ